MFKQQNGVERYENMWEIKEQRGRRVCMLLKSTKTTDSVCAAQYESSKYCWQLSKPAYNRIHKTGILKTAVIKNIGVFEPLRKPFGSSTRAIGLHGYMDKM